MSLLIHWLAGKVDMESMADDVRVTAKHVKWLPCEHVLVVLEESGQLHLFIWA